MSQGLKVVANGTLVVPPFECAWLTGEDFAFTNGTGCISFEAKSDTDVTIILKATPGARRWQPLQLAGEGAAQLHHAHAAVEPNYTVIFGSHRNSCLKFEKNAETVATVRNVPGAVVSGKEFMRFWVHYSAGAIAVGMGEPSMETLSYRWRDNDLAGPLPGIRHVGLSCWDRHACYRSIRLNPKPLELPDSLVGYAPGKGPAAEAAAAAAAAAMVPPLLQLCCRVAEAELLGPATVCNVLAVSELMLPATERLYAATLVSLARHLEAAHRLDPEGFRHLSPGVLVELLQRNDIPLREKPLFDIIADWARGHGSMGPMGPIEEDSTGHAGQQEQTQQGVAVGRAALADAGFPLGDGLTSGGDSSGSSQELPLDRAVSLGFFQDVDAHICMVLGMIRYPLMTVQELQQVQASPLVQAHPVLLALTNEALGLGLTDSVQAVAGPGPGMGAQRGTAAEGNEQMARRSHSDTGGLQPPMAGTPTAQGSLFSVENKRLLRSSFEAHLHPCRFQRRSLPASRELSYVCDGDQNGVLRHIGTMYGAQEWVNPMLLKRVDIRASSPTARHTDPRALAGDKFVRHNFAGPRYINGQPVTWWCVDLGPNHELLINYYTLRHDGSMDYPRHWVLQGSKDLVDWVDLRRHKADSSLRKPGQYASWPVMGPATSTAYRAFRVMLEGPTTSLLNPHNFCLSNMELYGYLYRLDMRPVEEDSSSTP